MGSITAMLGGMSEPEPVRKYERLVSDMAITYDRVHTAKKRRMLREMMEKTGRLVATMANDTPPAKRCQICGSTELPHFSVAFGFDMKRCQSCGLIFCDPYPSGEQINAYYNSEMKEFENEFFRDSFEARVEIFARRVDLICDAEPTGRLLDIGSAIGIFIESLHRADTLFEISACDLSVAACEELRARFPGITVHNCDAANLEADKKYDVITMWDTLEHIVDLHKMLATVRRLLRTGGLFVFSTPNTHSFEWLVAGDRHIQILPPGHVNLMNTSNIVLLMEKSGFHVEDQQTLNASLDISYVENLLREDEIVAARTDAFLKQAISDPGYKTMLNDYLVANKMAGNVVTLVRPT
jgi:2-polyprenyl-3-methyl-5-hydroxy-6-metoxy-1,4-benzoquinol methylase